jgi:hypothetical protein
MGDNFSSITSNKNDKKKLNSKYFESMESLTRPRIHMPPSNKIIAGPKTAAIILENP